MIVYADTSALVKLVLNERGSVEMHRQLRHATIVIAAAIAYVELWAALAAACRAGRLDKRAFDESKKGAESLWGQISAIPINDPLLRAAARLAERDGLRGYDAVHLAALRSLGAPAGKRLLACWDNDLRKAADRHGYKLFPETI